MKNKITFLILFLSSVVAYGQVGIGTENPVASAALEIVATDRGLLIPRLTKEQRDAILSPAEGLLLYQIDNETGFYYFDGNAWMLLKIPVLFTTLSSGKIYVGDGSNQAKEVALSGDVTIDSEGISSIGSGKVVSVMIKDGNVTDAKLDKGNISLSGFGAPVSDLSLGGKKIGNVSDPTEGQDATTKKYVDELIAALEARIVGLEAIVPPAIGDFRDGGVVFYVAPVPTDLNGDGILDKGLVCAVEDQSTSVVWYDNNNFGARYSTDIGAGAQNSKGFLEYSNCTNCAIYLASQYAGGGFNDWFLPSRDELAQVYRYRNFINLTALANGGSSLSDASYWSSSIYSASGIWFYPWWIDFSSGSPSNNGGYTAFRSIRAVRAF